MVTAAAGEDDLATSMWLVTLLALVAVALLAAVLSRSLEAALVVAIPLTLAAGWAFLILFLLPVDVDFLTAALGAIVVAICAGPRRAGRPWLPRRPCRRPGGGGRGRAAARAPGPRRRVRRRRRGRLPRAHRLRHPGAAGSRRGGSGEPAAVRARDGGLASRRRSCGRIGGEACGCRARGRSSRRRGARLPLCAEPPSAPRPVRSAAPRPRSVVVSPRRAARHGPWWRGADEMASAAERASRPVRRRGPRTRGGGGAAGGAALLDRGRGRVPRA